MPCRCAEVVEQPNPDRSDPALVQLPTIRPSPTAGAIAVAVEQHRDVRRVEMGRRERQ